MTSSSKTNMPHHYISRRLLSTEIRLVYDMGL